MRTAPAPSFSRSRFTCVSTVRVSALGEYPHTRSSEGGQKDLFALHLDPMRGNVDDELAQSDHLRALHLRGGNRPAEDCLDSQHELPRTERLGHVVVGPHLEADHTIDLVGSSREHDHWQTDGLRFPPQAPADFEARDVGQHDVEHEQVRLATLDLRKGSAAIVGDRDVMACATKVESNQLG